MVRFIFITGGVVSSLGKGLASAALGALLQARDYRVRLRKLDPYLNVDPGTMNPYQHGEVFVTDDGAETDLDLGHYERFTGVPATRDDNITTGQIYQEVLSRERRGDFLGGTVQVIPHVTDAIKAFITAKCDDVDFVLCEIGGTVGDIEALPFFEAIRQLGNELPRGTAVFLHLTLVPYIESAGEIKTKPTQHSVKELRSIGIQPDVLICRSTRPIPEAVRQKIGLFCNVHERAVIEALDADTIYQVPHLYHAARLDDEVLSAFSMTDAPAPDMARWNKIVTRLKGLEDKVTIVIVGKYVELKDAYKSLIEALHHGGIANCVHVQIEWLDAEIFECDEVQIHLENVDGIIVPGGFGARGTAGKIRASKFAREHKIPYFGICFGMHMAVLDVARHLAGIPDATSTEFEMEGTPLIGLMTEWMQGNLLKKRQKADPLGGTMRLGAYEATLLPDSHVAEIYQATTISERHRHRYEVNMNWQKPLAKAGLKMTGTSPDGLLPEIVELVDHPWYVGVQFHPEFKSRPFAPHPLFASFIAAAWHARRLV